MRRTVLLLCALMLLTACRPETEEAPPEESPLRLESLSVEIPRAGLSAQDLAQVARDLPESMKAALAAQGVEVESVTVSVSSSPASTAQAVLEGGIDLAFLPAEDYAALEARPELLLAAGPAAPELEEDPAAWSGSAVDSPMVPGVPALLCAAPERRDLAQKGADLTWEDLSIRWGAAKEDPLPVIQAVDLWLRDRFGETAAHVALSVYDSYEDLLQAAATGEIDLLPLRDDVRRDWAEAWTMDPSQTDGRGRQGLGRPVPLWEELPVLAVTDRLYAMVAAVRPEAVDLTQPRFSSALAAAVNGLSEFQPVLGPDAYAPSRKDALTLQLRLAG